MEYKTIKYTVDGYIGRLTINRPEALNALNSEVLNELNRVLWILLYFVNSFNILLFLRNVHLKF